MGFLSVLMLSRALGVAGFGLYSLAFSYWGFLNALVDLGVANIVLREIAKPGADIRACMESAIYIRLFGCILFLLPAWLLTKPLGLDPVVVGLVILGILTGFEMFYDTYFTAEGRMDWVAKTRVCTQVMTLILLAVAAVLKAPLWVFLLIIFLNPL